MTTIAPLLDQHTDAELTPPCELLTGDRPCPAPATHLIRFTVQDRPVVPIRACADHAEAARRHNRECGGCAVWLGVAVERIGGWAG